MITSLDISRFRGIRDLSIPYLGRINLVVGDNNSGKTSVLEALQLLRSPGLGNIYRIARQRESMFALNTSSIYENLVSMFADEGGRYRLGISSTIDGKRVSHSIEGRVKRILLEPGEVDRHTRQMIEEAGAGLETDVFEGESEYRDGDIIHKDSIHVNRYSRVTGTAVSALDSYRIVYVSPFEHLKGNTISLIVRNEEYKKICLKALQLFDRDIEDMMIFRSDISDRSVEYLKHRSLGVMPLSTYGDGIKKVLVLSNAIASAERGILLIDEIETAIHKKYYLDIYSFLVKAAKAFDVQVFITTHSIEAIDGLLSTQNYAENTKEDDITVVTLKRENNHTYSRIMAGRDVAKNREDFGFDVRL